MVNLYLGHILNVDTKNNSIYVYSSEVASNIPIQLGNITQQQIMPKKDDFVLFCMINPTIYRVIKIWESDPILLRGDTGRLLEGEAQFQSSGGSYVYLNSDGDVSIVDGGMRNSIKISRGNNIIEIEATEITVKRFTEDDTLAAQITIDVNNNITVKGDKVYIGKNTDNEEQFGDVVTSGPFGTYAIDYVTGKPIPGSGIVKAES